MFRDIYRRHHWAGSESASGAGAGVDQTAEIRRALPALLAELGVATLLDLPCGDYGWMRTVDPPVARYIGADLLPPDLMVLDLVLNQAVTPLMREATARGGTATNGQGSFLAGSAVTYRLLTGRDAPMEVLRSALAAELGVPEERIAVVGD